MPRNKHDLIFNLQVQGDKYARLFVTQKQRVQRLDASLKKATEYLQELRKRRNLADRRGGGVNAVKSRLAGEHKEISKLENRLSACKTRESKMISSNNSLKVEVDRRRATRVLSQQIHEKHQKHLLEIQTAVQESFEASNVLMAERDHIISQINSISTENLLEQENFDQCYTTLTQIVNTEKENAAAYRKEALEMDPLDPNTDYVRGNLKLDEEFDLKKTLKKIDTELQEEQQNIEDINEKLSDYRSTLTKLLDIVKIDDSSKIVEVFTRGEEENFALYRYIQNVNNEIDQLEEQRLSIENEKVSYSQELKEGSAHTRMRLMESLEESMRKVAEETALFESKREEATAKFLPLAKAVDKIFLSLGCNDMTSSSATTSGSSASGNNSGGSNNNTNNNTGGGGNADGESGRGGGMEDMLAVHGVTEGNILQFLAIIENRSSEVIQQYLRRLAVQDPQINAIGGHLQALTNDSDSTVITGSEDTGVDFRGAESDDEASDERPMTKEELKRRAAASMGSSHIIKATQRAMPTRAKVSSSLTSKKK